MKKFIKALRLGNVPIEIYVNIDCIVSIQFHCENWYIDIVGDTFKFNAALVIISEEDAAALLQLKAGDIDAT